MPYPIFIKYLLMVLALSTSMTTLFAQTRPFSDQAQKLASEFLIADTHIDVPYRMQAEWEDITQATVNGDFDYPRAVKGGLNTIFMSIYTPADLVDAEGVAGGHWQLANILIDGVEAVVARAPEKFSIVVEADQAIAAKEAGKIGLALGMENGSPIRTLDDLDHFHARGVRYITLAHSKSNAISDSSYDEERPHMGLSDFGRDVVKRMNKLGMMVDVSHLSDLAIEDVLNITSKPVLASHSSARHFTPGFERNLSDSLIKAIAENNGVVQINFGSSFLTAEANGWRDRITGATEAFRIKNGLPEDDKRVQAFSDEYIEAHPFPYADISDVVEHIEHVIELVGIDYVGLGSDYDGVGDSLPTGLKDVSTYPNLVAALLAKGHSEKAIKKIVGGNLLRVWGQQHADTKTTR